MRSPRRRVVIKGLLLLSLIAVMSVAPPVGAQIVLDVIDLGNDGGGIATNPSTNRVYVAVTGQLNVYDAETHGLVTSIPLPQNYSACYDLAVNAVTNRVYAVGLRTYVIDGNSNAVLANLDKRGEEVVVNPTTNRVYVAGMVLYPYSDPYKVYVLDGASNTWLPDIDLGTTGSSEQVHLAVNPISNRVYIAFTADDDLRLLDGNTYAEIDRVHIADIGHVAVDANANRVYVRTTYQGAVVLDGTTHTQVGMIEKIGGRLRLNAQTHRIYGVASRSPGYIM